MVEALIIIGCLGFSWAVWTMAALDTFGFVGGSLVGALVTAFSYVAAYDILT